jgi:hypothetical protein
MIWVRFGRSLVDGRWSFKRWSNAESWGVRLGFIAFGGAAAMPYYGTARGDLQHDVATCWHCLKRLYALVKHFRKKR